MTVVASQRVRFYDTQPPAAGLCSEVIRGLGRRPRTLPPKLFYDERGSVLFNAICELPEYYLTRTETAIIERNLDEIAALAGPDCVLLELGSGSGRKARPVIERLQPRTYVPLDISREHLLAASTEVADEFPWLEIRATCIDYTTDLILPFILPACRRVAFFPGSTIGNFEPHDATRFLESIRRMVGVGGAIIIGVDTKKEAHMLDAAYNDSCGITAEFNKNILHRINRDLGAKFICDQFEHDAFYNEPRGRVEMHLVSTVHQVVGFKNIRFVFEKGETIHTENSYKYTTDEFVAIATAAGFSSSRIWSDDANKFSVHYLTVPHTGAI